MKTLQASVREDGSKLVIRTLGGDELAAVGIEGEDSDDSRTWSAPWGISTIRTAVRDALGPNQRFKVIVVVREYFGSAVVTEQVVSG